MREPTLEAKEYGLALFNELRSLIREKMLEIQEREICPGRLEAFALVSGALLALDADLEAKTAVYLGVIKDKDLVKHTEAFADRLQEASTTYLRELQAASRN
jgi:hypothetical protein